tara:strand:- start:3832 stop:4488 length:657 start_codon:yes stop_codon:yes gene_type:complete
MLEQQLKKVVKLTSHTQRNWDVSVPFPQPHTKRIVDFAISIPTKNGINYFDLICVTDNTIKRELYDCTLGYTIAGGKEHKNSQILAPLVLVWVNRFQKALGSNNEARGKTDEFYQEEHSLMRKVQNDYHFLSEQLVSMHVGISSAYANIMAGSIGYKTGFCKCFSNHEKMMHTLGIDKRVELMLGIGEANETLQSTEHHDETFEYGTVLKEPIKIINL